MGRTIGDRPDSTIKLMFPLYAKAAGIDASSVRFVPSAPPSLPQLLVSGQVDGIGQFVVGKPLIEAVAAAGAMLAEPGVEPTVTTAVHELLDRMARDQV